MPYIQRELQPQITRETPPKAVVIFGARQIGKTTLLTELSQYEKSVRWFNGDLITDHRQLAKPIRSSSTKHNVFPTSV